jgi:hypothetical protein
MVVSGTTPSLNGITFPATQVASADANTLDDYEEGSWTPVIVGSSSAGTANHLTRQARYTKVGRMVFVETYIAWNSGTGTGDLRISGLPFTSSNSDTYPSCAISYFDSITLTANNIPMVQVNNNATSMNLSQMPVGGGVMAGVAYDAAGGIQVSGCYTI